VSASHTVSVGSEAPEFTLPRAGGGDVRLVDYRGRPVVVAFLRGYG